MSTIVEVSQADYARRRGLTPKAIEKAIDAGRIPASAVRRDGRSKLIDVAAADLAWPLSNVRINTASENFDVAPAAGEAEAPEAGPPRETPGLTKARTEAAQIDTRLKELQLDERLGKVRDVADVTRSMEICAGAMVRDLDQIPARTDDVATAYVRNGVEGVRAVLKQIAREIRTTMAANMRLLTADETAGDDETAEDVTA